MRTRLVLACLFTLACGSADVTIRDSAGADANGTTDAPLPDAPTMVRFQAYDHDVPANLPFLAVTEGDSQSWEELSGANGTYTFMVPSGRYGMAWVCPEADTNFTRGWVLYATTRDVSNASLYCHLSPPTATMTGSVSGLSAGDSAQIAVGSEFTFASAANPSYSVMVVPGQGDIAARREGGAGLAQILLAHDVTLGNTTYNLDFAQGFAPTIKVITTSGKTPAESISHSTFLRTNLGAATYLGVSGDRWAGAPVSYLQGNDVHSVNTSANDSTAGTSRWVDRYVRDPADLDVTLPDLPSPPSVEVVDGPYVRLSVTVQPSEAQLYRFLFRYYPGTSLFWTLDATAAWLEGSGGSTFEMPDFSNMANWVPAWGFMTGMDQGWDLETMNGNRTVFDLWDSLRYQGPPAAGLDGLERTGSRYTGTLTP